MMFISDKERAILRHTLGLDNSKNMYRNYFMADPTHSEINELNSLVKKGLMDCRLAPSWSVSGFVFYCTSSGKEAAK